MVHHDLWDYDNTAAPQLTTIRHNGQLVDVVAQAGKTGFLYVFNRVTGEPVWPIEERPVPKSDVPGEEAWPTQPFPTAPPPFAKQSLDETEINPYILTPEQRAMWTERIAKARKGGLFVPPAIGVDTVAIPGAQGGANWGTTAAHPTNGSVYVLSINTPSIYRLELEPPGQGGGAGRGRGGASPAMLQQGRAIYELRCQSCHGANLEGVGNYSSLVGITTRLANDVLRGIITAGRLAMPPNDLQPAEMDALVAFLGDAPSAFGRGGRGRGAGTGIPGDAPPGPIVARGGAPGNLPPARGAGGGGMAGPPYPEGVSAPTVRYYTDYGMQSTLVKPPYATLTAYDLNTGTIKWQVPAGGDEPRAVAQGAANTGYPQARTGIITTATGLLFQAGLDRKIRAYDVEIGQVIWTGELPGGSVGIPAMYEVNGKQYLLVSATQGGGGPGGPAGGPSTRAYVAFALP
jgi:quinoprotein glucose dehydrogenase